MTIHNPQGPEFYEHQLEKFEAWFREPNLNPTCPYGEAECRRNNPRGYIPSFNRRAALSVEALYAGDEL